MNFSKKIKSKYRSENSIYRILNSFMHSSREIDSEAFSNKIYIFNVRDVNIGVGTDIYNLRNGAKENKIGVK